ncbi:Biogenesis of lysosome-related organelles complex 1 subunit 4-like [Homarus americanus]|uniref:Biogenesis of lysosome-related organelles complex 1 subunit 4-like n=1 Tax=Homarus americanus TaxID=6706 RepID=A0A8J5JCJ1_HOMAM|nr:Biogenesis of lysosome-related organelles complex 1 subunit 4-like [Homarus americanus]
MSGDYDTDKREQLLRQTADDYASYCEVDASPQRAALDHELESMLTRLEEYGSLLERTRSESRHTLDVLVPQVYSHYQALQRTFQSIDHLEILVKHVKEDLVKMETCVSQAETDIGSSHGFTTKKDQLPIRTPTSSQLSFQPPKIFHAEDYFTSTGEVTDAPSSQLQE